MAAKKMIFDQEARQAIAEGVKKLARAVKITLGPGGRNVILQRPYGSPLITKDGVTVAKEIELEDAYENIGAQMVKEVAAKTSALAGDGTTTATIYAESIFSEGLRNIANGANATQVQRGIHIAVEALTKELRRMSQKVVNSSEIVQVGSSSANNDTSIGKMIADAMDKVGKEGVITVEEGNALETSVELAEGMQFDRGYISPHFVTDFASVSAKYEDCYVLIAEKKINSISDILNIANLVAQTHKPLLVIAEDVDGEALTTLVINKLKGILPSVAIKSPGFGDSRRAMLEDIAVLTGGTAILSEIGIDLEKVELSHLGVAKKIIVSKENTTIIEGNGDDKKIQARIEQLRSQIGVAQGNYDREKLQERLAKLAGGIAQIKVGAATETAMKEKKDRVEDALHACRAAVEEGILPGGGTAILRAVSVLDHVKGTTDDQTLGIEIVRRAVEAPIKQIAHNSGEDGAVVAHKVKESTDPAFGYNALTHSYGNLIKMGVIVPTKVERIALENAASIAGLLLTTEAVVSEIKDNKQPEPEMAGNY